MLPSLNNSKMNSSPYQTSINKFKFVSEEQGIIKAISQFTTQSKEGEGANELLRTLCLTCSSIGLLSVSCARLVDIQCQTKAKEAHDSLMRFELQVSYQRTAFTLNSAEDLELLVTGILEAAAAHNELGIPMPIPS